MTMSKSVTADLCSLLSWDTSFWGIKIARINRNKLTQEDGRQAINWCASNNVGCLYFSADGTCRETLSVAASNGFAYVDTRIDLQISTAAETTRPPKSSHRIREAGTADLPVLRSIARRAHTDTRFFKDANFSEDRAAELYEQWIERDYAEHTVLVAVYPNAAVQAVGYITCQPEDGELGRIGLVGVSETARNRGVGSALVAAALEHFRKAGKSDIRVATQGTNIAALRLYESAGFRTHKVGVWFHRWFGRSHSIKLANL